MNNFIKFIDKKDVSNEVNKGIAQMRSYDDKKILGYLYFEEGNKGTRIYGELGGFSEITYDGLKGFHIHSKGNPKECCEGLGDNLYPFNKDHGARLQENGEVNLERHIGDLSNIEIKNGMVTIDIIDELIHLNGEHSIIGR